MQYNHIIENHYNEIREIYVKMRGWRHDYHNHLQTMKVHMKNHDYDNIDDYLSNLETDLMGIDTVIKSGNITLDAILNSKVSIANNYNIKINLDAYAKEKMTVSDLDLCIIIGNLMDNAIDACRLIENKNQRFITIYIGMLNRQFYISITNATNARFRNESGVFITTKDRLMHGNGLNRIDMTVDKYNGYVERQNEPYIFCTEVLLPV
jgi:sensor histidine kinase regulating citrate/malate metabolism